MERSSTKITYDSTGEEKWYQCACWLVDQVVSPQIATEADRFLVYTKSVQKLYSWVNMLPARRVSGTFEH